MPGAERNGALLAGRVAVVTGGSRGIGRAIAVRLGRLGASVVLNYHVNETRADEARRAVLAAGAPHVAAMRADVGKPTEARRLVESVLEAHDRIDILVHNAAVQRAALLHEMTDQDWQEVIDVNLSAAFHLCRAALPSMLSAGRGYIVLVASASAFIAQRGACSYVASKHGLVGLTKALAVETAGKGVLVNAVAPGLTDTDLVRGLSDAQRDRLLSMVPLRRMAEADEIAALVAFLVTEAGYSTGNVFHASGGVVMG